MVDDGAPEPVKMVFPAAPAGPVGPVWFHEISVAGDVHLGALVPTLLSVPLFKQA
jgi:hypothetical protein